MSSYKKKLHLNEFSSVQIKNVVKSIINLYESNEYGWCRFALAKTHMGRSTRLGGPECTNVCVNGALMLVIDKKHISSIERCSLEESVKTYLNQFHSNVYLAQFNDRCKSKRELISMLKRALKGE